MAVLAVWTGPLAAPPVDRVKGRRRRPRPTRVALDAGGGRCYLDPPRARTRTDAREAPPRQPTPPSSLHTNGSSAVRQSPSHDLSGLARRHTSQQRPASLLSLHGGYAASRHSR